MTFAALGADCTTNEIFMRVFTLLLPCVLLLSVGAARAQEAAQSLQAVRDAALAVIQAGPGAQATLVPGLRLKACKQPLVATAAGPQLADVRCPDVPGWRLYVPVRPADTSVGGGTRGNVASVDSEILVRRGDPVVLRAAFGASEVRMGGRALGQARAGGIVNVENDSSHRIIRGRLAPDGTVEVIN